MERAYKVKYKIKNINSLMAKKQFKVMKIKQNFNKENALFLFNY